MADIVENAEIPVVEKEVEETDAPKVVEADDKAAENGHVEAAPTKNGDVEAAAPVEEEEEESKDGEEEAKNGDATDAPATEAVKRKVESDSADAAEETAEIPEKKSKLSEETIATVEAEATA
ncbi:hypothetical protein HA402_007229 [Bradysia odoriphaga]|nr:hypothetical protein HA402_007229 [Bradysia odoriphaga]